MALLYLKFPSHTPYDIVGQVVGKKSWPIGSVEYVSKNLTKTIVWVQPYNIPVYRLGQWNTQRLGFIPAHGARKEQILTANLGYWYVILTNMLLVNLKPSQSHTCLVLYWIPPKTKHQPIPNCQKVGMGHTHDIHCYKADKDYESLKKF